jgi:hypothetical protein
MAGQRVELPPYSMYVKTPMYDIGGSVVFGQAIPPISPSPDDMLYTVPPLGEHRLDLISNNFYGVPDLWWIIASVNLIEDPLVAVDAGKIIRIPTRDRLANEGLLNV